VARAAARTRSPHGSMEWAGASAALVSSAERVQFTAPAPRHSPGSTGGAPPRVKPMVVRSPVIFMAGTTMSPSRGPALSCRGLADRVLICRRKTSRPSGMCSGRDDIAAVMVEPTEPPSARCLCGRNFGSCAGDRAFGDRAVFDEVISAFAVSPRRPTYYGITPDLTRWPISRRRFPGARSSAGRPAQRSGYHRTAEGCACGRAAPGTFNANPVSAAVIELWLMERICERANRAAKEIRTVSSSSASSRLVRLRQFCSFHICSTRRRRTRLAQTSTAKRIDWSRLKGLTPMSCKEGQAGFLAENRRLHWPGGLCQGCMARGCRPHLGRFERSVSWLRR
jgi:hypothetical protein